MTHKDSLYFEFRFFLQENGSFAGCVLVKVCSNEPAQDDIDSGAQDDNIRMTDDICRQS